MKLGVGPEPAPLGHEAMIAPPKIAEGTGGTTAVALVRRTGRLGVRRRRGGRRPDEPIPGMAAAYAWLTGGFALLAAMAAAAVWLLTEAAGAVLQAIAGAP